MVDWVERSERSGSGRNIRSTLASPPFAEMAKPFFPTPKPRNIIGVVFWLGTGRQPREFIAVGGDERLVGVQNNSVETG